MGIPVCILLYMLGEASSNISRERVEVVKIALQIRIAEVEVA